MKIPIAAWIGFFVIILIGVALVVLYKYDKLSVSAIKSWGSGLFNTTATTTTKNTKTTGKPDQISVTPIDDTPINDGFLNPNSKLVRHYRMVPPQPYEVGQIPAYSIIDFFLGEQSFIQVDDYIFWSGNVSIIPRTSNIAYTFLLTLPTIKPGSAVSSLIENVQGFGFYNYGTISVSYYSTTQVKLYFMIDKPVVPPLAIYKGHFHAWYRLSNADLTPTAAHGMNIITSERANHSYERQLLWKMGNMVFKIGTMALTLTNVPHAYASSVGEKVLPGNNTFRSMAGFSYQVSDATNPWMIGNLEVDVISDALVGQVRNATYATNSVVTVTHVSNYALDNAESADSIIKMGSVYYTPKSSDVTLGVGVNSIVFSPHIIVRINNTVQIRGKCVMNVSGAFKSFPFVIKNLVAGVELGVVSGTGVAVGYDFYSLGYSNNGVVHVRSANTELYPAGIMINVSMNDMAGFTGALTVNYCCFYAT